jgi:hypothetical protein
MMLAPLGVCLHFRGSGQHIVSVLAALLICAARSADFGGSTEDHALQLRNDRDSNSHMKSRAQEDRDLLKKQWRLEPWSNVIQLNKCPAYFRMIHGSLCYRHLKHEALVPTLFIMGCTKCGSTSLHQLVVKTFDFVKDSGDGFKETHFFCGNQWRVGCDYYLDFPGWRDAASSACAWSSKERDFVGVDGTPNYLSFAKDAPRLMRHMYGEEFKKLLRFVAILRNPTARLLSDFNHFQPTTNFTSWALGGLQTLRQGDAAAICQTDIAQIHNTKTSIPSICAGLYVLALHRWKRQFLSSQFLLIPFSTFVKDPRPALLAIAKHMGRLTGDMRKVISDVRAPPHKNRAAYHSKQDGPSPSVLSDSVREELDAFFRPFTLELVTHVQKERIKVAGAGASAVQDVY